MNIVDHLKLNLAQPLQNRTFTYSERIQDIESKNRYEFLIMLGEELREETMLKNPLHFGQTRFYSRVDEIEFEMNQKIWEKKEEAAEENSSEKEELVEV